MASIYCHIPFRRTRCPYREEYYEVSTGPFTSYIDAVRTECVWYAQEYASEIEIESLYVGGGEPSLLSPRELKRLFGSITDNFTLEEQAEVTLEVHPNDLTNELAGALTDLPVNRVSLGIESFYDRDLRRLGCSHTADVAAAALSRLSELDLPGFNVDLWFGLPEQPVEYWAAGLQKCARLGVPHISTYRVDTNTWSVTVSEELISEQYQLAIEFLTDSGYRQYELSHFARAGHSSRQLLGYWSHGNCIGLGAGAHSFWRRSGGSARRWENVRHAGRYRGLVNAHERPIAASERVSTAALVNEYLLMQLQTSSGIDLRALKEKYGADLTSLKEDELSALDAEGWIDRTDDLRIRLSEEGKFRHETVFSRLMINTEYHTTR